MSIVTEKDDPSLLGESNLAEKRKPRNIKNRKNQPNRPRQSKPMSQRFRHGGAWPTIIWIALIHVGALAAPFCFTWSGLFTGIFLYYFTGCVGVTLGLHRYLTHAGFKTTKPVRWALAFIGQLSGEGSALDWVATHRKHHAHSDKEDDPHSPLDGAWWAHIIWLFPHHTGPQKDELHMRWGPDLRKDKVIWFFHKTFIVWHLLLGAALLGIGYAIGGWYTGISMVVYGMFLRLTVLLHVTWFVNSATHMWGYRNYETTDKSTNLWWVGLAAFGEGWHNNHHAYPRMAVHGHKWWEFDLTWNVIRVMRMTGMVWDVVDYKQKTKDGALKI